MLTTAFRFGCSEQKWSGDAHHHNEKRITIAASATDLFHSIFRRDLQASLPQIRPPSIYDGSFLIKLPRIRGRILVEEGKWVCGKIPVPAMLRITKRRPKTTTYMPVTLEMDDWVTAAGVLAADALDALGPRAVHLLPRGHPRRQRRVALLFVVGRQDLMMSCGDNAKLVRYHVMTRQASN